MTKENAKEFLPLVQTLAEGKTVQYFSKDDNNWVDVYDPCFCDNAKNYRIKPEVEHVPFDTAEELIECWNKKKFGNKHPPYNTELEMPLIWVKHKNLENETILITAFDSRKNCHDSVFLQDIWVDLRDLFETFTFLDGTPIGKIKE